MCGFFAGFKSATGLCDLRHLYDHMHATVGVSFSHSGGAHASPGAVRGLLRSGIVLSFGRWHGKVAWLLMNSLTPFTGPSSVHTSDESLTSGHVAQGPGA